MIPLLVPPGSCPVLARRLSHEEAAQLYKVSQLKPCSLAQGSTVHLRSVKVVTVLTSLGEHPGLPSVPELCLGAVQAEIARSPRSMGTKRLLNPLPALSCSWERSYLWAWQAFPQKTSSVSFMQTYVCAWVFSSPGYKPVCGRQGMSLCSQSPEAFLSKPCGEADPPGTTLNSCPQLRALGWCPGETTSGTPRSSIGYVCFSARKIGFICNLRKFAVEVIKTHQIYTFPVSLLQLLYNA